MATRMSALTTVAALAALALGVAALVLLLARPQATAAATLGVRQITVVGNGEADVTPDMARVQIGVQTQAASAGEALSQNNANMEALLARLREQGIANQDIQTSSVSISPRYDYNGPSPTQNGYDANNTVTVTIRNIAQTGQLLDQVVQAGANNIGGINFTVDDPSALQTNARNAALTDAKTRAEAMAQAVGGTVGQVLSVTENIGQPPQVFERAMAASGGALADTANVPIEPGQQTITAQVQVTYELR